MTDIIRPGGTIGILGGGAMGHMLALSARTLGYRVRLLDDGARSVPDGVADFMLRARPRDPAAAAHVATGSDVVTVATENVPRDVLEAAALHAPLRPGTLQLAIAQERRAERTWLEGAGFAVAPWRPADSRDELVSAVRELGVSVVKPRLRRHPDLRPLVVCGEREAESAWVAMRGTPTVVETFVPIDLEVSVLVARAIDGSVEAFPPVLTVREYGELAWSVLPAPIAPQVARKAQDLASYVARKLDLHGVLTVELFVLVDGRMVVNELVPAPHPAFLAAESACATGQFEQLVRAITGLPLGATAVSRPAATVPIRSSGHGREIEPRIDRALEVAGTRAVLYGPPGQPGNGAPIGHLYAIGNTPSDAAERAARARARLTRPLAGPTLTSRRSDPAPRW